MVHFWYMGKWWRNEVHRWSDVEGTNVYHTFTLDLSCCVHMHKGLRNIQTIRTYYNQLPKVIIMILMLFFTCPCKVNPHLSCTSSELPNAKFVVGRNSHIFTVLSVIRVRCLGWLFFEWLVSFYRMGHRIENQKYSVYKLHISVFNCTDIHCYEAL